MRMLLLPAMFDPSEALRSVVAKRPVDGNRIVDRRGARLGVKTWGSDSH